MLHIHVADPVVTGEANIGVLG